ncbi:hypothetical protein [Priestia aryabhattai]
MGYTLEEIKKLSLEKQVEILMNQFNAIKCCGENCSNDLSNVEYEILNGKKLCRHCFVIEKQKEREAVMHQILEYRRFVRHAEEEIEKLKKKFDIKDKHLENLVKPIALAKEEVHSFSTNTIKEEQPVNVRRDEDSSTQQLNQNNIQKPELKSKQKNVEESESEEVVSSTEGQTNVEEESLLGNNTSKLKQKEVDKSNPQSENQSFKSSLDSTEPFDEEQEETYDFIMVCNNQGQGSDANFNATAYSDQPQTFKGTGSGTEQEFTLKDANNNQDNPNENKTGRKPLHFTQAPPL